MDGGRKLLRQPEHDAGRIGQATGQHQVTDDHAAACDAVLVQEQLRADLMRAVPGEDSDLPRLGIVTPPAMVPSIVLAHRLYGDTDREADLVTRNRIPRPGFIRGGEPLEVLGA